jgi:hypothetical protein
VIQPEVVDAAIRIVRAEEAWEPVLFGGMIPIVGALAVVYLIWRAVKENPENDLPPEQRLSGEGSPYTDSPVPGQKKEDGPKDPPSR